MSSSDAPPDDHQHQKRLLPGDDAPADDAPTATSKKLQRRLQKQQRRAQLKAAGAGRPRKRRSQRDCNRYGTAAVTATIAAAPTATYAACASRSCGDGAGCRLRTVAPYVHRFETFAKARWGGRPLADVFTGDFAGLPPAYCEAAIATGLIRVNGERKSPQYVIRGGDLLEHVMHRHEPPVHFPSALEPSVAATTPSYDAALVHFDGDDVVVVNKPSSIPVHPSGAYLHNSMTKLLQNECGMPELFPVHRLDRLTSGLLLLAKSPAKARELCEDIASGLVQKHYVARVLGEFPRIHQAAGDASRGFSVVRGELIELTEISTKEVNGDMYWRFSAPIGCVSSAEHLQGVTRDGKTAETLMRVRSFDGTHSVVECLPVTGRTHQIRVHLQFLGFPIVNDPQYGPPAKTDEQRGDCSTSGVDTDDVCSSLSKSEATGARDDGEDGESDEEAQCAAICSACKDGERAVFSAVQRECFAMWLHSFKYTSAKWAFEVPLPRWAQLT